MLSAFQLHLVRTRLANIVEFEMLDFKGGTDGRVMFENDPHVVWRVDLVKLLILDRGHFFLDLHQVIELGFFQSICAFRKLVGEDLVVEGEVDIYDLRGFRSHIIGLLDLSSDGLDKLFLELNDGNFFSTEASSSFNEVLEDFLVELALRCVVIDRHEHHVCVRIIDLVQSHHKTD